MGMFTTVTGPNNFSIQIYLGNDLCDTYSIGEEVPHGVNPDVYDDVWGLDGVYYGYGDDLNGWVIIKNHRVEDIIPCPKNGDFDHQDERERIVTAYEVHELVGEEYEALFTEEAIRKEREAQEAHDRELAARLEGANTPAERLARVLTWPIERSLNYQALIRQMVPIETNEGRTLSSP